jgi:hypothetical protein
VVAAKRKSTKKTSDWSWRLGGFALCAFFGLGMIAGLSGSGKLIATRAQSALDSIVGGLSPGAAVHPQIAEHGSTAPVALVKRPDGFYTLYDSGRLEGPVTPASQADLPILSGAAASSAGGSQLVDYASILIRAEVSLASRISEMTVEHDGDAILYLDRTPLQILIGFDDTADQLARAAKVLSIWRGHRELLVAIDATVPGQAIARLRPAAFQTTYRASAPVHKKKLIAQRATPSDSGPEVTASR